MSRRPARVLVPLALLLTAAACSVSSSDEPTTSTSTSPSTTPSAQAGQGGRPGPTSASVATTGAHMTDLTLTIAGRAIPIELDDNATARDLAGRAPLSLTFSDFGGQEKTATLPAALTMEGVPAGADPEANEIGYYAPNRVLVLYYEDIGYFDGIVRLGRMSADDMRFVREQPDGFSAELDRG
ncbi:MAG: hypothetical protein LWW86_15385 [Micrococcales bacterium]|nr:hypothetical protein [Micrococcales bacterium]